MELLVNGVCLLVYTHTPSLAKQPAELTYHVTPQDPLPELHDYHLHVQVHFRIVHAHKLR